MSQHGESPSDDQGGRSVESALRAAGLVARRLLGRGGFGSVYEAERSANGQRLAIKIAHLQPREASRCLERECEALRAVGAPWVPAVYEQGMVDGRSFFAMEYLEGATLSDQMIEWEGRVDLEIISGIASAILQALSAVHGLGFVHCDLKPENIILEPELRVRLIDFGTVCCAGNEETRRALHRESFPHVGESQVDTRVGPGTAEYMSPEQCAGDAAVDRRSDLYAFGVILHEMLTGAPPFWGSAAEVREAHRSRRPPFSLPSAPALWRVVLHCLAKEPDRRPRDVETLQRELQDAFATTDGVRTVGTGNPPKERSTRTCSKGKCLAGILYFDRQPAAEVIRLLGELGGSLAYSSASACAAVFGPEVNDNPARSAFRAGEVLVGRSICARCIVDLGVVSTSVSHDGATRYFSPSLAKPDRYPRPEDPAAVLVTSAAAQVLGDQLLRDLTLRQSRQGILEVLAVPAERDGPVSRPGDSLVGRGQITRDLLAIAHKAKERGCPAVALVLGSAGLGKTHLLRDLAYRLQGLQFDVVRVRSSDHAWHGSRVTSEQVLRACLEPWSVPAGLEGGPAGGPARGGPARGGPARGGPARGGPARGGPEFLRELLGHEGDQGTWAAVSLTLGWLPDHHPEIRTLRAAPGALRSALTRGLAALLRRRAERSATALLLDGAEMADDAALEALERVSRVTAKRDRAESGCPLFIVVAARAGFERGRRDWGRGAPLFRSFELGPLPDEAARELAKRLLEPAEHVPGWAIDKLVARTQGVPGLLVELVRGLLRDGLLRRHERGTGHYFAGEVIERLPEMPVLRWSTQREVESLPADLVAHARLASIFGGPFQREDAEALLAMLEQDGKIERLVLDVGVALSRLLVANILIRGRTGMFEFRTALVREAVYQATPEEFRGQVHRALFRMLLSRGQPVSTETMAQLAFHAAKSGSRDEARARYGGLGERALDRQSYQEAATMLDLALGQAGVGDDPDARRSTARLAHLRGLARFRLGRLEEAAGDFVLASELAGESGLIEQRVEALLANATVADWMRDFDASERFVNEAERCWPKTPPERLAAELLMARGRVSHRRADQPGAVALFAEAARRAEGLGDAGYEILVVSLVLLGFIYPALGRVEDAEGALDAALRVAEAHHDQAHMAAALNNRVPLWFARGDEGRLLADLERVLHILGESGLVHALGPVEGNLAEALYCMGDIGRAREHALRALDAYGRVGASARSVNSAELLLARIELAAGDLQAVSMALSSVGSRDAKARAGGEADVDLLESDRLVMEALKLAVSETPDGGPQSWDQAWERIIESGRARGLAPYEYADLHAVFAWAARRAGRSAEAETALERAIDLARDGAPILLGRLRRTQNPSALVNGPV